MIRFNSRFANGAEYAEFFGRLEKLEAEHQKYLTESLPQVDIKLRWEDLNGKVIAKFIMVFNEAGKTLSQSYLLFQRSLSELLTFSGVSCCIFKKFDLLTEARFKIIQMQCH